MADRNSNNENVCAENTVAAKQGAGNDGEQDVVDEENTFEMPRRPKGRQGQTLSSNERTMVWRQHKALMVKIAEEFGNPDPDTIEAQNVEVLVRKRVCEIAGIHRSTYKRIIGECKDAEEQGRIITKPGKKRPHPSPKANAVDELLIDAVRRKVSHMYKNGELPTSTKLFTYASKELGYQGKHKTFLMCMKKKMGFKYKKVHGRKMLLERYDVQLLRDRFLRKWKYHKERDASFVYLDETWTWQNHKARACWQSDSKPGNQIPIGKGQGFILLHAGTANGFVPNAQLSLVLNSVQPDYQKNINAEVFTKWFSEQLLPNIPEHSIIIMDSAPYHSVREQKVPTSISKKSEMLDWLMANGVTYANMSMRKVLLYELIRQNRPRSIKYVVDSIATAAGHTVLRTPLYHGVFNLMEHIWVRIRNGVGRRNNTSKMSDFIRLTKEEIGACTPEVWKECVERVEKICSEYLERDPIVEGDVENMFYELGGDSNASDSDEEEDNDSDEDVNQTL